MSERLLKQMAWVIAQHWKDGPRCYCGQQDREYTEHVAEKIIADLKLHQETNENTWRWFKDTPRSRWVTDWESPSGL